MKIVISVMAVVLVLSQVGSGLGARHSSTDKVLDSLSF